MFYVITNMYNKKTKRPTLMELLKATENWKKVFLQLEMFDVHTTGDTAHIDTIFQFLPHTRQHGCIDILYSCNDPCLKARSIAAVKNIITNISQADLHKVFANKIKRIQARIDACGHHFQHLV
jgi:hypothetical protein